MTLKRTEIKDGGRYSCFYISFFTSNQKEPLKVYLKHNSVKQYENPEAKATGAQAVFSIFKTGSCKRLQLPA